MPARQRQIAEKFVEAANCGQSDEVQWIDACPFAKTSSAKCLAGVGNSAPDIEASYTLRCKPEGRFWAEMFHKERAKITRLNGVDSQRALAQVTLQT